MVDARCGSTVVLQGDLAFVGAPRQDSPDLQARPHSLLLDGLDRDGRASSSGVYFARLDSEEGWSATVKLTLDL